MVELTGGVVNEFPVPKEVPPTGTSYQLTIPNGMLVGGPPPGPGPTPEPKGVSG